MATEVEYVNYKDFVAGLESTESPDVDDVTVVSNSSDGPRTIPANTSALSNTATDSDLTAAASIELQTVSGKKKAPANLLAKQSGLESANANVAALATYAQNVANENIRQANIIGELDIGSSIDGYVTGQGTIQTLSTHLFRHFEVPVEIGKKYVVRTRLGTDTTFIGEADSSGLTSEISRVLRDSTGYANFAEYEVTPTKPYLYVTFRTLNETPDPYTGNDYLAFVVEKNDTAIIAQLDSVEKENVRQANIIGELDISSSIDGYVTGQGTIQTLSTHLFRHFEVPVEIGKKYVVRTRLGTDTTFIGEADSSGLTSEISRVLRDSTGYANFAEYEVTPTKPYLYVTFRTLNETPDPYTGNDYLCFVAKKRDSILQEFTKVVNLTSDLTETLTISENTIIYGHGHKISLGTELELEFTEEVGECVMAVDEDSDTYKCFVSQTMDLVHSGTRPYKNVTLWAVNDTDITKSKILTPKLTLTEVDDTDDSFTYDGTKYIVHCSGHSDIERFVLCPDGNSGNCLFNRYYKLKCYDVVFEFAADHCARTFDSEYCEFVRCEFRYAKVGNGVIANNDEFCRFDNCVAHHCNNDGFAPGHLGYYELIDCVGCYCDDDGVSNHGDEGETVFVIRGGEYHHNRKGGVSSPVYGSIGDIVGVHLHDNTYGVYTVGPVPSGQTRNNKRTNKVCGCLIASNTTGVRADGYKLTLWNNVFKDNATDKTTANGGVIDDCDA